MADDLKCSKCNTRNPEGSEYCNSCGKQLGTDCTKCGHTNPQDTLYCNKCGSETEHQVSIQYTVLTGHRKKNGSSSTQSA